MNKATQISLVSKCTLCPALGKDHVPASGPVTADLCFVGQSPGTKEVEEGQPFVGPSGELLDYLLDEIGLSRDQVYITNSLKCHPPGNRAGHPEELDTCFQQWLKRELVLVNPRVVVLVGKDAWQSVTRGKMEWGHGLVTKTSNRAYMSIFHPAYFLRRGDIQTFLEIAPKLKELLDECK